MFHFEEIIIETRLYFYIFATTLPPTEINLIIIMYSSILMFFFLGLFIKSIDDYRLGLL